MFNRLLNTPLTILSAISRSSRPEAFLRKDVLKICSKFTEKHPCRSVILIKLQSNFIEIALLQHGCSPVNLLHIFRTLFIRTTMEGCLWSSSRISTISSTLSIRRFIPHFIKISFFQKYSFWKIFQNLTLKSLSRPLAYYI